MRSIKPINLVLIFFLVQIFSTGLAVADNYDKTTLRAGFYAKSFPDFSVEDIEISVKLLSEEIGREIGIDTKVYVYEDTQSMRRDFDAGIINFVVASSVIFVTEFDGKDLIDGFRFVRLSEEHDRLLVIGRLQPGKETLEDYKGQRLILAQYDPTAELYLDFLTRTSFKQNYKTIFKQLPREKKAHQLILKLFFDQADITCLYQNAYETAVDLNPQLNSKVRVLAHTDKIPQGMGFFHAKTPKEFQEQVIAQALKLTDSPHGQQLLELFKSEQVKRSTLDELNAVENLYREHQRLTGDR